VGSFISYFGGHIVDALWLTDKTQVLYFSSRFLILKNKTRLAALFILLL
jgi:hypothetical protein